MATVGDFLDSVASATGLPRADLYATRNGKRAAEREPEGGDGVLRWAARLVGGKGGFGSMLRAIGAQIEKTTNREACRDLSGRRLRDIREEQRLREWAAKRERDDAAQPPEEEDKKPKKEKPERALRDDEYDEQRRNTEKAVDEAVEEGFEKERAGPSRRPPKRPVRAKLWIEDEISDLSSDDDESDGQPDAKRLQISVN